jgi:DNA helicase-2/ATP-dependent DNA helicase PcrA
MLELQGKPLTPAAQFDLLMEYYEPIFEKIYYDDYPKRKKEIEHLKSIVAGYGDLQSLIDDTTLDPPESGQMLPGSSDGEEDKKLILSTIHSAKGLEWDSVFVIGLAEGRFPHQNTTPGEQWEEERRLLYVAATRAKRNLYLTYPQELMSPDRQFMRSSMSPFLREINPGLYVRNSSSPLPPTGGCILFLAAARSKIFPGRGGLKSPLTATETKSSTLIMQNWRSSADGNPATHKLPGRLDLP